MKNQKDKIQVSVIIPVFNHEKIIKCAIDSVLKQTFPNFELLIIDDGSEKPIKHLEKLDNRIKVIVHKQNMGASAARNTGIKNANGKYIAFLDSDDEWDPMKLEIQTEWMVDNPCIYATTTGFLLNTPEENIIQIPQNQKNWYRYIMKGMGLCPGTTLMVINEIMKDFLYDLEFPRLEDLDWGLRFTSINDFYVIQKSLATINNFSSPSGLMIEKSNLRLIEKHRKEFKNEGFFYSRFCISKRFLETSIHFFLGKKFRKGMEYFIKCILTFPFQRPGMYIRIIDALFGINLILNLKNLKYRYFNQNNIS
ncbi:MAG: glycosyltransferase family 2 protein [Anaerolineaceae bacterium]|nr:glycosyltransferase family 2 protein [Anaerolineaceae bacterium]